MSAAATGRERADERETRHRRARATHHRRLVELEQAEEDARHAYGYACAKLVLGEGDEAAVLEAEAELERLVVPVQRARAADAYLSAV